MRKHKGKCYYCGCNTRMSKIGKNSSFPNMATRDHLYSKMDIRRLISEKSVLACKSCNEQRAYREHDLVFNNGSYQTKEYSESYQLNNGLLINLYQGDFSQIAN